MNKKVILILGILVVIIFAIFLYNINNKKSRISKIIHKKTSDGLWLTRLIIIAGSLFLVML